MTQQTDQREARLHLEALAESLTALEGDLPKIAVWGQELGGRLGAGARLLVAGNGGSAAHAFHLAGELVGNYRRDRQPLSALALTSDPASLTAITNDHGVEDMFARQVRAHGRPGDVFIGLSTSGSSANVVRAAEAASRHGLTVWALTGAGPNELTDAADDSIMVAADTPTVQEIHQVVIHLLCAEVESMLPTEPQT